MNFDDINLCQADNWCVAPQFYMTRHCNLACPGCYMGANPSIPQVRIPTADISFYLNALMADSRCRPDVVFSGGEIFTLPMDYLEYNIQNALNLGYSVQLKTNGAFVNTQRAEDVFNMIKRLLVPVGIYMRNDDLKRMADSYPKWKRILFGKRYMRHVLLNALTRLPMLSIAVSVDNLIHPEQSAEWFAKLANRVTTDKDLANRVTLKTYSFADTVDFVNDKLMSRSDFIVTDVEENQQKASFSYKLNGCRIESFFGEFVDVSAHITQAEYDSVIMEGPNGEHGVVLFFYPDGTAGLETAGLHSIGRVPYKDATGQYKTLQQLKREIFQSVMQQRAKC